MVIAKSTYEKKSKHITNPKAVNEVFTAILRSEHETDRDKEHFWVIGLTTRNSIKYIEVVRLGTLNASLVYCREVYRLAIAKAVSNLILVHNHPSGYCAPSDEDLNITRRLIDAGKIIGIQILDHVIIGDAEGGYTSFKEAGLL